MEVAGLVLGAIPILLKGIDIYIELYGEWAKETDLLAKRRRQLMIEHLKLKNSLRSLSPDLDEDEVNETLILCYPDDYKTIVDTIEDLRQTIWKLREQLDIDTEGKPVSSNRVHSEWRRIKRSFKKKETKELFDEIYSQSSGQHQSFNKRVCQRVRRDACVIHEALSDAYDRDCTNAHLNMIDLSWHNHGLRTFQLPDLSFPDRDSCSQAPQYWHTAKIRLEPKLSVAPVGKAENMDVTTSLTTAAVPSKKLHKIRFGISLRASSPSPSPLPAATPPMREHIRSICSRPAQKLFGGYLLNSDPDNQSMVILERKQPEPKHAHVLDWRSLLTSAATVPALGRRPIRRKKMSKKDRLGIASAATWAVLLLCGTPWLEETKMIENDIVLLTEEKLAHGSNPQDLDNANAVPAFSYRFTKPDAAGNSHPKENENNQSSIIGGSSVIPHRTLFALAVLLIEIGLDTEFRNLYEESVGSAAAATFGGFEASASLLESYRVADEAAEALYDEMGDPYAEAAKRCLRFNFPGRRSLQRFDHEMLRQHFFSGVVAPVHERYEQEQTRHRVFRTGSTNIAT